MSFTIFPKWIGQVLNPFLLVLGSEMLVDWLKHAYITKFNQTKPEVYGKFLDVLAKDYYSDAFSDASLTRRLGLPVIPLACLFIRAALQTYHMFLATHMPPPFPATTTSLTADLPLSSSAPTTTAALAHIDHILRRAFGRSSILHPSSYAAPFAHLNNPTSNTSWSHSLLSYTIDDLLTLLTLLSLLLLAYLLLLTTKLLLGMFLLRVARARFQGMKERERASADAGGRYVGGWGTVEVDDEKRRWVYEGDEAGLRRVREREERGRVKDGSNAGGASGAGVGGGKEEKGLGHVERYAMVAKRIW